MLKQNPSSILQLTIIMTVLLLFSLFTSNVDASTFVKMITNSHVSIQFGIFFLLGIIYFASTGYFSLSLEDILSAFMATCVFMLFTKNGQNFILSLVYT